MGRSGFDQKLQVNPSLRWSWMGWSKILVKDREAPVLFRPSSSSMDQTNSTLHCTFEKYIWALRRLEGVLPLWPGTLECRVASHDHNAIMLLDSIAQDITKSYRPSTQLIIPGTRPNPSDPKHMVVKREASASRQSIKYPWNQKMFDEAEKLGEYRLFMQPYVPEWDKVGQWRCLMVNQVIFCIFNHPGSSTLANRNAPVLAHNLREDGWSLEELCL